jgi:short-subunit dehydrogenase
MKWRGAYIASKFALEGLTDTLRLEMRDTDIHVALIEPGPITSEFRRNAVVQFEKWIDWENSPRADQYRASLLKRLYSASNAPDRFELGPEAVTRKLIHAIEADRPHPRYFVTTPTYIMNVLRRVLPTRVLDWVLAKG